MEYVASDTDLDKGLEVLTELVKVSVQAAFGTTRLGNFDLASVPRVAFGAWMRDVLGYDYDDTDFRQKSLTHLRSVGVTLPDDALDWEIYEELMKNTLEPNVLQAQIVIDFPPVLQHVTEIDKDTGSKSPMEV